MQEVLTGNGRLALLFALGVLALPARGIEFGEIEILSPLGEKLDARIPVKSKPGEWFHVTCIVLGPPAPGAALPAIPSATLSVERRRDSANLRLRSAEPVNDPALGFSVSSTCAGASSPPATREFSVLVDPPEVFARQQRARPKASTPIPPPTTAVPAPVAAPAPRGAAPAPIPVPTPAPPPVVARKKEVPAPSARLEPAPRAAAPSSPPDFVLKLTSAPIDLARTRQFDDKTRAQLRERLRLLDSDDQVAAMLSMQDNLRRLEARVAELQLKLATTTAPAPSRAEPPKVEVKPEPPKVEAKPEPARVETQPEAPKIEAKPEPPKAEARPEPPKAAPPIAVTAPPKAEPPTPAPVAASETGPDLLASLPGGLLAWLLGLTLIVLVLLIAAQIRRRRAARPDHDLVEPDYPATAMMTSAELDEAPPHAVDDTMRSEQPFEVAAPLRSEMASDAALATRLEEDTEALRRRYMEERFPEIRDGTIVLDDPASVVKGARLFYEDGAIPKAVELLRFAIEDRPTQLRHWLALFEIYRLERLTGEYGELASRFQERHGETEQWAKVRGLGRELDPANPLFQEPAVKGLETIGPRESRRLGLTPVDPITENWLEAPMDFENEVLAMALRRALMARAKIEERDLVPNPMPALRSVEMFSVG